MKIGLKTAEQCKGRAPGGEPENHPELLNQYFCMANQKSYWLQVEPRSHQFKIHFENHSWSISVPGDSPSFIFFHPLCAPLPSLASDLL
jgi:hypothetical protein